MLYGKKSLILLIMAISICKIHAGSTYVGVTTNVCVAVEAASSCNNWQNTTTTNQGGGTVKAPAPTAGSSDSGSQGGQDDGSQGGGQDDNSSGS